MAVQRALLSPVSHLWGSFEATIMFMGRRCVGYEIVITTVVSRAGWIIIRFGWMLKSSAIKVSRRILGSCKSFARLKLSMHHFIFFIRDLDVAHRIIRRDFCGCHGTATSTGARGGRTRFSVTILYGLHLSAAKVPAGELMLGEVPGVRVDDLLMIALYCGRRGTL